MSPPPGETAIPPSLLRERVLGRASGVLPGPLVIINAGIHGNEPAGVLAAERVLASLHRDALPLRGEVAALAGNLAGLARNIRFIDKDLNRQWTPERLSGRSARGGTVEDREQRDLRAAIRNLLEGGSRAVVFLDLHTFSSEGAPFVTIGDALRNRAFAWHFPVPVVLGLEEEVDGALLEWVNNLGHVTLGMEGGNHRDPVSVDNLESLLWIALVAAGSVAPAALPDLPERRRRLQEQVPRRGRFVEVVERVAAVPGSRFRMMPGFRNLQQVRRGELLARCGNREIRASADGLLLLPLYQDQGDDGFFLCRRVRTAWLHLSALLRKLRLGSGVHLLPGVRRHPELPGTLEVDTRIAHWYPLEVFHLLGFRKRRSGEKRLVVSRRVE